MRLKEGVRPYGLRTEMLLALLVAEGLYAEHDGAELVITSIADGAHSRGSLHYQGSAVDLRTRHLPPGAVADVAGVLAERLGDDYDVVLEADHIHLEYQPKVHY